jgi:hypothetical protein
LEMLVKWERNTVGVGAGPGSPNPLPDHGATGAPASPPGWPSTTPKWLGTLQYIGTHPLRCDGSEQTEKRISIRVRRIRYPSNQPRKHQDIRYYVA